MIWTSNRKICNYATAWYLIPPFNINYMKYLTHQLFLARDVIISGYNPPKKFSLYADTTTTISTAPMGNLHMQQQNHKQDV